MRSRFGSTAGAVHLDHGSDAGPGHRHRWADHSLTHSSPAMTVFFPTPHRANDLADLLAAPPQR